MQALARFIMKGPPQAILVAVGFGLFSLFPLFGFLGVVSAAAVALVTLRHGARPGFTVIAAATLIVALFMMLMGGDTVLAWILSLLMWVPVWLLALVLRTTISWARTLSTAIVLAFVALSAIYMVLGDPALFWQRALGALVELASEQGASMELMQFQEQLPAIAGWLTGFLVAVVLLGLVSSLLLARWWQSLLYNPGGFQQEFHALRMGRETSIAVFVVLLVSLVGPGGIGAMATDLLMSVMVVYGVSGLGFVHHLVAATGKSSGWLVALYAISFVALPHVLAMLAAVGFTDSWTDLRARLAAGRSGGGSDRD